MLPQTPLSSRSLSSLLLLLSACGPGPAGTDAGDDTLGSESAEDDSSSETTSGSTGETDGACVDDSDCPPDQLCEQGLCQFDPCLDSGCDTWGGCMSDDDCPFGQICQAGQCVDDGPQSCSDDRDCPAGVCLSSVCEPAPELSGCGFQPSLVELPIPEALLPLQFVRAAVGDFDGDGVGEVVALREASLTLLEVFTPGDASASSTSAFAEPLGTALLPLHVDDDGKLDLISDHDIFFGDGDGTFSYGGFLPALGVFEQLAGGDLDGDGRSEPVKLQDSLHAWRNTGGAFELLPELGEFGAATLGDFDGDQRSSLAVSDGALISSMDANGDGWTQDLIAAFESKELTLLAVAAPGHHDLVGSDIRSAQRTLIARWREGQPVELMQLGEAPPRPPIAIDIDANGFAELLYVARTSDGLDASVIVDLNGCTMSLDLLIDGRSWQVVAAGNADGDPAEELLLIVDGSLRVFDIE